MGLSTKYAIASDIHGSATWCKRLLEDIEAQGVDRIILLGDLMYHGPRNPLPEGYDPAEVAQMLNEVADKVVAVRGNCDSEVDQMLLDFPCTADYTIIVDDGRQLFCTHGHLDLDETISKLPEGSIVLTGHTHIKGNERLDNNGGVRHINPGSVSIPKDGSNSYAIYENGEFAIRTL